MAESAVDAEEETAYGMTKRPPTAWDAVGFWAWHSTSWAFYILLTIVYIPWAIAMHFVMLALLIVTLPALYWRVSRKVHLYAYVVLIMVPGKFLWYNLFRYNRRKGQVWDYEMGKPRPVDLHQRRRLSVSEQTKPQPNSPLFTKLPPEVRLRIYRHAILGNAEWFYILGWPGFEPAKSKDIKIRAYPCVLSGNDLSEELIPLAQKIRKLHKAPNIRITTADVHLGMPLFQTCRKVYNEGIDMLYTLPTFTFKDLHRPPYFLRTVLPHRLALIRNIHIVYDQSVMTMKTNHVACSTAKFAHKMGQCVFCNPIHWFNSMNQYMAGLKNIKIFIFMRKDQRIPDMGRAWITRMLELQTGPNGLRKMEIDVTPNVTVDELGRDLLLDEEEYLTKVKKFKEQLEQRLKKGVDRYAAKRRIESKPTKAGIEDGNMSSDVRITSEEGPEAIEMLPR